MAADSLNLKALRNSLASLAERMPSYSAQIANAGFECCHLNEKWIAAHCDFEEWLIHQLYSVAYAGEALAADQPSAVLTDAFVCRSDLLNELKAKRLAEFGLQEDLYKRSGARHLAEVSPGWQKFMRVRESAARPDKECVEGQLADFVLRRAIEISAHGESIARCKAQLLSATDALSLQGFFAKRLTKEFAQLGARTTLTLQRNQSLRCDEQVAAVAFALTANCQFVLLPIVIVPKHPLGVQGTLSVGFRLMTTEALEAPKFEFGRDTVLHLRELLPGKFNDYCRFDKMEELCLNILAWTAGLRILLPDVLQTLSSEAGQERRK